MVDGAPIRTSGAVATDASGLSRPWWRLRDRFEWLVAGSAMVAAAVVIGLLVVAMTAGGQSRGTLRVSGGAPLAGHSGPESVLVPIKGTLESDFGSFIQMSRPARLSLQKI